MTLVARTRVGRWTAVVRELPLGLGFVFRLEDAEGRYVGPERLRWLGPLAWWWSRGPLEFAITEARIVAVEEGF